MSKSQEPHQANIHASIDVNTKSQRKIAGGCHCQAVRFSATVNADAVILRCNCSICSMTGFKHLIVKHQNFKLLSGQNDLTTYQFNTKKAKHLFCKICGIKSFYQPRSHPDSWSINTNCIDNFDNNGWTEEQFDGKNWQQSKAKLDGKTK